MNLSTGGPVKRVLFLCQGNGCRSIIAEALARHFWEDGAMAACSAGIAPLGYIPSNTLEALKDAGISSDGLYSKGLSEFSLNDIDYIVNLTFFEVDSYLPSSFSGKLISCPITDPFGRGIESFRQTIEEIKRLVGEKLPKLIGTVSK
ncbi:Protein-tyrosine phosphatase, low molecular weight [Syntrophobacter sp. SbD1]|nr:Protein-tyrosine phosphatase, low molecular weight [Syntrophobacter sp. SbD1]